jgi:glucose-6-phosphate isomerase
MLFVNFNKTDGFKALRKQADKYFDFAEKLDEERVASCITPMAAGLRYSWAAKAVNDEIVNVLQALAKETDLVGKFRLLAEGAVMNTGENRMVLHHLLRGALGRIVIKDGMDLGQFYADELERFGAFAEAVREGRIAAPGGGAFTNAVQIGIGGSDLGPRALYLALENWGEKAGCKKIACSFISNVDPDDGAQVLSRVDLARTLFVLVSKSGTTQETLANELLVKAKLEAAGLDPSKQLVAVTSETSPLAHNPGYLDSFYIDDYIGGRYSSSSAVGGVILSLAYGAAAFRDFLAGAHQADILALEPDVRKNAALLDALIGVWERNFLGYPATAILPYSQALSRFPAHLQQLDMESNGKRVNRFGEVLKYASGPLVFGEPGTNGQHSFYQLLHQGTDVIPLQFIGFLESQRGEDVEVDGSTSQTKLKANLAAQIAAFACGNCPGGNEGFPMHGNQNKTFPGRRPSSLIIGERLEPASLGALLAHYENKVMFQGFVWNLNSFDQEGVQLGKVLTKSVLAKDASDSVLAAYAGLLGV